jgi:hypothetical protein
VASSSAYRFRGASCLIASASHLPRPRLTFLLVSALIPTASFPPRINPIPLSPAPPCCHLVVTPLRAGPTAAGEQEEEQQQLLPPDVDDRRGVAAAPPPPRRRRRAEVRRQVGLTALLQDSAVARRHDSAFWPFARYRGWTNRANVLVVIDRLVHLAVGIARIPWRVAAGEPCPWFVPSLCSISVSDTVAARLEIA